MSEPASPSHRSTDSTHRSQSLSLEDLKPRRSPAAKATRFTLVVLGLLILVWAWGDAGLANSGLLWSNRTRAVDYIFGQKVDESTLERRREEVVRDIRTEIQNEARAEIVEDMEAAGEPIPPLMTLMRMAEEGAAEKMEALPAEALNALIEERLDDQADGQRRGGYLPPETDPKRIFGDPKDFEHLPGWLRWPATVISGEGYTGKLMETIAIAIWGTIFGVMLSAPAALLGASSTLAIVAPGDRTHHRVLRFVGKSIVRRSFDLARGLNEVVLAMIFVAVLGLGPLPGVMALVIHTYGVLGKVLAEALETIDAKPIEGVTATGAAPSQIVAFAVLPQILPYGLSQSLLRFETNVRGATILGVVGAGGIGQLLMSKFGSYAFPEVATMMIIIVLVVTLIDWACGRLMRLAL